jgi:hypothetical protein
MNRRNVVLNNMLNHKHLTQEAYDTLKVKSVKLDFSVENNYDGQALYFREAVKNHMQKWCNENGYDLYRDGLKIYTTIDTRMQKYAEEAAVKQMKQVQRTFNAHWGSTNPWQDEHHVEIPHFIEDIAKRLPIYKRLSKPAQENDIPVVFHNCGKEELFLDFMVEFGVEYTEPAQEDNDILAMKEKYKGKLTFMGCWGWGDHIPAGFPEFDEEEFRQDIRDTIDKYSVGGGYAFAGFPIGQKGEEEAAGRAYKIMRDEAHWYGRKVYGYTDD